MLAKLATIFGMSSSVLVDFENYSDPGLYLHFEDGRILRLTRRFIEEMAQKYLSDPGLLPQAIREAPAYAPCEICPKRETAQICHAIPTVFPFIEDMNRFLSFQKVVAVFRSEPEEDHSEGELTVSHTSVQRALQYVSILSLMGYCEVGLTYYKYFTGIVPIMNPLALIERVYLNIFWDMKGNQEAIHALIAKMHQDLDFTLNCQLSRLQLFCKSDAFLNAFVNTHVITQFLEGDMEGFVRHRLASRSAPPSIC
jgi:hypothetical protein